MSALSTSAVVAVIGAGTMGAGIAQVAASAGHSVLLYDAHPAAIERGIAGIASGLDKQVARGKLSPEASTALLARIQPASELEQLAPAALVIEAIVENLQVKQQLFQRLEQLCSAEVILASNTSSLSITAIGAALARPERLAGLHFFNPAPVMKLVEVISGVATCPEIAECLYATASAWGKQAVHARSTPGFIVNRVARPYYAEALRLLQEGAADVATLDALLREAGGFPMGPFELMDLIGHDVNYAVTSSVFAAYYHDTRFTPSLIQQELVAAGRWGRKSGQGFYDYRPSATRPTPLTAEPASAPKAVVVHGELGVAEPLVELLMSTGITVERVAGSGWLSVGATRLALSDGRTATQRALEEGCESLVLFDLALDYARASRIALSKADQCSLSAAQAAIGLFQALGKQVSLLDDVPGLAVLRTVCMLANEGLDAVNQGVCSAQAVDIAMRAGVNYPRGPLAWADAIGLQQVATVLDHLARHYGEPRYRASSRLRRYVYGQRAIHV